MPVLDTKEYFYVKVPMKLSRQKYSLQYRLKYSLTVAYYCYFWFISVTIWIMTCDKHSFRVVCVGL